MSCDDITAIVSVQPKSSPLPPEVTEHVAGCEPCRKLVRVFGGIPEGGPLLPEQVKLVRKSLLNDLQPVRPLASSGVLFAGFLIAFVVAAFIVRMQSPAGGWHALNLLQKLAVFATLLAGAALLSISMAQQMRPGSRYVLSPAALPLGLFLALSISMVVSFQPQHELRFVSHGLVCLLAGVKIAALGGALTWLILRRGANLSPKLLGVSAGALAGLMGLTMLEVHCPDLNLYHILLWHLGVLLLSILAGLALGAAAELTARRRYHRVT